MRVHESRRYTGKFFHIRFSLWGTDECFCARGSFGAADPRVLGVNAMEIADRLHDRFGTTRCTPNSGAHYKNVRQRVIPGRIGVRIGRWLRRQALAALAAALARVP